MADQDDIQQPKRRKGVDTSSRRLVDRDHKRSRRAAQEEGQRLDLPCAIPEGTKSAIYDDCRRALSNDEMSEKICCVCDRLCKRELIVQKALARGEKFQSAMKDRLRPPADLPAPLQQAYSAAHVDPSLDGMLLSSEGIFTCRRGNVWLRICKHCHSSLSNTLTQSPPKYAIANGLYFGALPAEFEDSTPTENAMLNLGQPTHYISAVRGGAHSTLRSQAYIFRSRPESPATMVPAHVLRLGAHKVRMVGALTPRQKYQTMRRYQVRTARLQAQLHWYQQNNVFYQNDAVRVNDEVLQRETCVVVDQTSESGDQQLYAPQLDEATQRFNAPDPAHLLSTVNEEGECEEQATVSVVTDFPRPTETEDIREALGDPDVIVHRSSDIMSDFNPAFWALSFCDLYPFGRGGLE